MPLIMGILAQAVGVPPTPPAAAGAYDLLETEILTGSQASVTFDVTGLGSTYQHLQIRATIRSDRSGQTASYFIMQVNGDTGNNYSGHFLYGESGSVGSGAESSTSRIFGGLLPGGAATANQFAGAVIDVLDPFETSKNTTFRHLTGHPTGSIRLASGAWYNTNALTSITLKDLYGSNFVTGSRFSLMGQKAA